MSWSDSNAEVCPPIASFIRILPLASQTAGECPPARRPASR